MDRLRTPCAACDAQHARWHAWQRDTHERRVGRLAFTSLTVLSISMRTCVWEIGQPIAQVVIEGRSKVPGGASPKGPRRVTPRDQAWRVLRCRPPSLTMTCVELGVGFSVAKAEPAASSGRGAVRRACQPLSCAA